MFMKIHPIIPEISGVENSPLIIGISAFLFVAVAVMVAVLVGGHAAKRFKGNKKKVIAGFVVLSSVIAVLLFAFFGLSARAVRGIIFCHILLVSSYADIKTRKCDDWLHIMILLAGFIGLQVTAIPGRIFTALFIGIIMLLPALVGKKRNIGGADIKLSATCAFLLGIGSGTIGLILGLTGAILIKKNKAKGFPLLPYLSAAFMAVYFI